MTDSVDDTTLENILTDQGSFDIFILVESMLAGKQQRSLRILANLYAEDTEPTLILWAITRELRTLAEIIQKTRQGVTLGSLFSQFRIWEKRQPAVRAFLQRHTFQSCCELLLHAANIDRMIKGVERGSARVEFERLLIAC